MYGSWHRLSYFLFMVNTMLSADLILVENLFGTQEMPDDLSKKIDKNFSYAR